jgi:hypothetical protein
MPIILQKMIYRTDLRKNLDHTFVFGDNYYRTGYGGQAYAMRGEPNAYGIPTKVAPDEYMTDDEYTRQLSQWARNFYYLHRLLESGGTIVWPSDGIGTGLADLQSRAPLSWNLLQHLTKQLFDRADILSRNNSEDHH